MWPKLFLKRVPNVYISCGLQFLSYWHRQTRLLMQQEKLEWEIQFLTPQIITRLAVTSFTPQNFRFYWTQYSPFDQWLSWVKAKFWPICREQVPSPLQLTVQTTPEKNWKETETGHITSNFIKAVFHKF